MSDHPTSRSALPSDIYLLNQLILCQLFDVTPPCIAYFYFPDAANLSNLRPFGYGFS